MFVDGTSGDARYRGYMAYDHNVDTMKLQVLAQLSAN